MATYKEFAAAAQKQWMSQSQIDTAWGKAINGSSNTKKTTTTQQPIQTTQTSDMYWDKSGKWTAGQYTGEWIKTSQWLSVKPTEQKDLWSLAKFGADVYADQNFDLSKRNDIIANNLLLSGQDTAEYLNQFSSFKNASDADKQNTIRAINERLKEEYEKKITDSEIEISELRHAAEKEAAEKTKAYIEAAREQADGIIAAAEEDAERRKVQILESTQTEMEELVIEATQKILTGSASEEHTRNLYDEFIRNADKLQPEKRA